MARPADKTKNNRITVEDKEEAPMQETVVSLLAEAIRETTTLDVQVSNAQQQLSKLQTDLLRSQGGQDKLWRLILPEGVTVDEALEENLHGVKDAVEGLAK
jgi:hypothetical protein